MSPKQRNLAMYKRRDKLQDCYQEETIDQKKQWEQFSVSVSLAELAHNQVVELDNVKHSRETAFSAMMTGKL